MSHTLLTKRLPVNFNPGTESFDICIGLTQWMIDIPFVGQENIRRAVGILEHGIAKIETSEQKAFIQAAINYLKTWIGAK